MENNLENKITPLSPAEVAERRERGQVNIIPDKITKSHLEILRTHTFTLFNGMNFLVAVALFAVGAYRNMIFFLAICLNIFVAVAQEFYAKHLVEKLSIIGQAKTVVLREEGELEISIEELVLDDISVLTAGSQICADAVLLAGQLEVDESLLTGESDAVVKLPGDKLMSGSFVISGHGQARVTAVGNDNYAAKIAREAKIYKKLNSKLVLSMRKITSITGWLILPLGALLMAQALHIRGDSLQDAVVFSSAALLGFLPNGLVLMISAALIAGIAKLARMKVLVQDLYAIECLARVDVLCLDKTGTITEGKMQVQQVLPLGEQPFALESVMCKLLSALPDNNATFTALRGYFAEVEGATAVASTPFSAQRKYCAAAFEDTGVIVLGAPEVLYGATPLPREILAAQGEGLRVLSVGFIADPFAPQEEWVKLQTPFACIILSDPIRPDTHQTLEYFRGEGVRVKIISGDNPVTVSNVARLAGFAAYQSYVDMSAVADKNIAMVATKYDIFGRVSPEQKKMLVRAMREAGSTVAMTGDGVNDVLALREADCSIAMASGSDAAKQASQLVLVNSDVAALTKALAEGRRV
ncbi:MAG: HAD-IC family P-type ATPase, partial [Oscillospiraceae bacterium]|nr:HAD-IC family P-type ATPase [Oscillospiraceae bacterium]